MLDMGAVHSLTAEMHAGFLTLAILAMGGVFLCQLLMASVKRLAASDRLRALRGLLEPTALVALVAGIAGMVLSAITGSLAWPTDGLLNSPITRNKIVITVFALVLWSVALLIRLKLGRLLWTSPASALLFVCISVAGFAMTAIVGSLGAHIVQGGSVLGPLLSDMGIDPTRGFTVAFLPAVVIIFLSAGFSALALLHAARSGLIREQFRAKDLGIWPGWN